MLLELLQAVTGIFVVVYDGQNALRFTLGRADHVVGPGLHFKLPIIQRFRVEETKHTTLDLQPQVIQLEDDLVYEVDAKVMYQIVDLKKALIQIDDLVTGLQNRVVMAVQKVVRAQDRGSVRDTVAMIDAIRAELKPVEEQWGVAFLQVGFSNISPSPASLEITQLELLARERLGLYQRFEREGLPPESAVALITGAVVTTPGRAPDGRAAEQRQAEVLGKRIEGEVKSELQRREERRKRSEEGASPDEAGDAPGSAPAPQ